MVQIIQAYPSSTDTLRVPAEWAHSQEGKQAREYSRYRQHKHTGVMEQHSFKDTEFCLNLGGDAVGKLC